MGISGEKKESLFGKVMTGAFVIAAATAIGAAAYYKPENERLQNEVDRLNKQLKDSQLVVDPRLSQAQASLIQCKTDLNRITLVKNDAFSAEISKLEIQQKKDVQLIAAIQIAGAPAIIDSQADAKAGSEIELPPNLAVQAAFLQKQIDDDFASIADMRRRFEYVVTASSPTTGQKEKP